MNLLDPRIGASARALALGAMLSLSTFAAAHDQLRVQFSNCREYVGVGPVDHDRATALVPSRFTVAGLSGPASIVVRVSNCETISVNGASPRRGTVAHIGINIVAPDGDGNINNYTIAYASDHAKLVDELRDAGVNAVHDGNLGFEFVSTGPESGEVFAAVTPEASANWFVHGTTGDKFLEIPFTANWWRGGSRSTTKMSTVIPMITFRQAGGVSFFTARNTFLGNLIGGNKVTTFSELPVLGEFGSATMIVTRRP